MNKTTLSVSKDAPIVRSYTTEYRAESGNKVVGLAAVYNSRTAIGNWFYEIIDRGAFDETDLTDVLFCVNHDLTKIPLARSRRNNGNSTMQLFVNERGLNMESEIDVEKNAEASALYSAIERGDITGMSFMFRIKDEVWEDLDSDMPTRRITKVAKVWEVSAVNFPAYESTGIDAREARSLESDLKALENARAALDKAKNEVEMLKLRNKILSNVRK
jgi:hypothetical protein